jgi:RNA polymerase sigma-70 factor (ECF subfamily)
MTDHQLAELQGLLDRIRAGDQSAANALLGLVLEPLESMARKMKRGFPGLAGWEGTGDVLQESALRIWQELLKKPPETVWLFFSVAARKIRGTLIDMLRHYYGPEGPGGKIASNAPDGGSHSGGPLFERGTGTHDPAEVMKMTEIHRCIEALPEKEREVFDLLWYHELKQEHAAAVLGVSLRTVKLRWQAARTRLGETLREC